MVCLLWRIVESFYTNSISFFVSINELFGEDMSWRRDTSFLLINLEKIWPIFLPILSSSSQYFFAVMASSGARKLWSNRLLASTRKYLFSVQCRLWLWARLRQGRCQLCIKSISASALKFCSSTYSNRRSNHFHSSLNVQTRIFKKSGLQHSNSNIQKSCLFKH